MDRVFDYISTCVPRQWCYSTQVAASTKCRCNTDETTCTPPVGDIDCRNCGVYYKQGQGDFFQCVKQCPERYYGSQTLSECVPCSNVTEHCIACSSASQCDYCDYPFTLQGDVCGEDSSDNTAAIVLIVFFSVLACILALIVARCCYKKYHGAPTPEGQVQILSVSTHTGSLWKQMSVPFAFGQIRGRTTCAFVKDSM